MRRGNTKSFTSPLLWHEDKKGFSQLQAVSSPSIILAQFWYFTTRCCSTEKNFLHPVCSDTGFIFWVRLTLGGGAVWGGAAWGGTFWGTQVVHQWEPVLPTEVHKLNLSDTAVEVDSSTFWVWAINGRTQVPEKIPRKIVGSVRNISDLNGSCS